MRRLKNFKLQLFFRGFFKELSLPTLGREYETIRYTSYSFVAPVHWVNIFLWVPRKGDIGTIQFSEINHHIVAYLCVHWNLLSYSFFFRSFIKELNLPTLGRECETIRYTSHSFVVPVHWVNIFLWVPRKGDIGTIQFSEILNKMNMSHWDENLSVTWVGSTNVVKYTDEDCSQTI